MPHPLLCHWLSDDQNNTKIWAFYQKGINYFWQSFDAILKDVSLAKTILDDKKTSIYQCSKICGSQKCVTRLIVAVNVADHNSQQFTGNIKLDQFLRQCRSSMFTTWPNSVAWNTNLVSVLCPTMTKTHNWQIINMWVMLFVSISYQVCAPSSQIMYMYSQKYTQPFMLSSKINHYSSLKSPIMSPWLQSIAVPYFVSSISL